MALIEIRNRWVNFAGPYVVSSVIFTGVLVGFGDSFGHAILFSLSFNAVVAFVDSRRGRVRDAKRRRQQQAIGA